MIGVLLLAMAFLTPAQPPKSQPAQGSDAITQAQALFALENKWVGALAKSDIATLDSIFDDSYVDTDEQSHRSDKPAVISVLKSGDLHIASIKLSDPAETQSLGKSPTSIPAPRKKQKPLGYSLKSRLESPYRTSGFCWKSTFPISAFTRT
jgi:hypothetical protein